MIKRIVLLGLLILAGTAEASGKRAHGYIPALSQDPNGCHVDQTTSGAATLTMTGDLVSDSVCVMAAAQKISYEGSGSNAGVTATIVGTNADGVSQTEDLALSNGGTATTVYYYKTLISTAVDGAVDGNIEAGPLSTNGAVSETLLPDLTGHDPLMSIAVTITGTLTYTVEHTSWRMPASSGLFPTWFDTVDMIGLSANGEGNIVAPVGGVRVNLPTYTSGTAAIMIVQARRP